MSLALSLPGACRMVRRSKSVANGMHADGTGSDGLTRRPRQ
jgi:hypothetical protein